MKETNFLIHDDGSIDYKAIGTSADLYGRYNSESWSVHFSETKPAKQVQMEALRELFEKATANSKRPEEINQNSANTFAYRLYTDSDTKNADIKRQAAYKKMVADALKISNAIKQNNGNSQNGNNQNNGQGNQNGNSQSGNNQSNGQNNGSQNNQNSSNGQSQNSGNQNGSQNNGNSQNGNNQSNGQNNGGQSNQNGNGGQPPQFDRTIDILTGRPIKERYPEYFLDCKTKEEEEKKYDEYWKIYQEVTDLFAK